MEQVVDELVIERVFAAPIEQVWRAWTEAELLAKWWGPKGFTMKIARVDLRPGGMFHYSMQAGNGPQMWGRFVYQEVQAPQRLAFISAFSDETGGLQRSPMASVWPLEVLNKLTFSPEGDQKTRLVLRGGPVNATEEERQAFRSNLANVSRGMGGTLDQLEAWLTAKGDN